jgi:hypothetical protein
VLKLALNIYFLSSYACWARCALKRAHQNACRHASAGNRTHDLPRTSPAPFQPTGKVNIHPCVPLCRSQPLLPPPLPNKKHAQQKAHAAATSRYSATKICLSRELLPSFSFRLLWEGIETLPLSQEDFAPEQTSWVN